MRIINAVAVLAMTVSLLNSSALAECKQSKINSLGNKFQKQCVKGSQINNEKIPATDAKFAGKDRVALDKRDQASEKLHTSTDQKIAKIVEKNAFYALKKAEALATCALELNFGNCQGAISFAKKIADGLLKIAKLNEQESQKETALESKYQQTVNKNNAKHSQETQKLLTKLNSAIEKAEAAEHQAVVQCGSDPAQAPFVCDLLP